MVSTRHILRVMSGDPLVEQLQKEAFVKEWLRSGDTFKAAHSVFPSDPGRAMRVSWDWPNDKEILEYRAELLIESGGVEGIPSKDELAREIYQFTTKIVNEELRLKGYELFAKVRGYVERPAVTNIDNRRVTMTNKVLIVKDHGSDDAWERSLSDNQKRLTAEVGN